MQPDRAAAERTSLEGTANSRPRREFITDGENFYFTIGIRESDVWVMDLGEQP